MKNVAIKGKYIPQNKSKFLSRRKPVNDISYKDEIFEINYKKFTFLKKEREHLIILLMASYRPSVIQSIIKETP